MSDNSIQDAGILSTGSATAPAFNGTQNFVLTGRTILVTGASSGIGKAVAILCASLGAKLVINGRSEERLQAVFEQISPLNSNDHQIIVGDLTEPEVREKLIEAAPVYDGLAYCAGSAVLAPVRMASEKHLQQMLAVNYLAPASLTQRLLYKKKLNAGASLVYVTALASRACPSASAAYAASKAALESYIRTLALEHGKQNIRATYVAPGYVDTPMLESLGTMIDMDKQSELTPMGKIESTDIAPGVAYLLSPASRWVTRSILTIDGGLSIAMRL